MSAQLELKVSGMTCDHCKNAVASAVKEVDGVASVTVDLNTGGVKVGFADTPKAAEVRKAIEEAGYEVQS